MIYLECAIFASLLIVVAVSMWGAVRRTFTAPRQGISHFIEESAVAAGVAIVFIAMMRF